MAKQRSIITVIMRAQVITNAHVGLIKDALNLNPECVVVLLGSANVQGELKNPWCGTARRWMLEQVLADELPNEQISKIRIECVDDEPDDDQWVYSVRRAVKTAYIYGVAPGFTVLDAQDCQDGQLLNWNEFARDQITILGHEKDDTSYYLDLFPGWNVVKVGSKGSINATQVREDWLDGAIDHKCLPKWMAKYLSSLLDSPLRDKLIEKRRQWHLENDQFKAVPYRNDYRAQCVDAVVKCSGYLLLVQRPNDTTWRLPGGHVKGNQTRDTALTAELHEEAGLRLTQRTLSRCVIGTADFDDPTQHTRPLIRDTKAYHLDLDLGPDGKLPEVAPLPGEDVCLAKWFPMEDLVEMRTRIHGRHWCIIKHFLPYLR